MVMIPGHSEGDIDDGLDGNVEDIIRREVKVAQHVGESFINEARELRTYNDVTGNLRSSVGYAVAVDAQIEVMAITGGEASKTGMQPEGESKGRQLASRLASDKNSTVLIGVAGMEYGGSVEARGKDVITGPGQRARKTMEELLREI